MLTNQRREGGGQEWPVRSLQSNGAQSASCADGDRRCDQDQEMECEPEVQALTVARGSCTSLSEPVAGLHYDP